MSASLAIRKKKSTFLRLNIQKMLSSLRIRVGENVLKAIQELGFIEPTPIQQQAIPVLLADETDFIGLAQTGTGKTAAFGLPILNSPTCVFQPRRLLS